MISEKQENQSQKPELESENWTLGDVRSDLHIIHFGRNKESSFNAGEKGASQSIDEIVEFAFDNLPSDSLIVIGNHSLGYGELQSTEPYGTDTTPTLEQHQRFLQDQRTAINDAMERAKLHHTNKELPTILFGLEADIYCDTNGTPYLNPPPEAIKDPSSRPDLVIASFHHFGNQIPEGVDRIDALTRGFLMAIESNVVHKFGHLLDQLTQIREKDPDAFRKIVEAAKAKGIIFEINTGPRMVGKLDQPQHQKTLQELIENGNLMDMGSDFHNFSMFKQSGLVAESKAGLLSEEEQAVLSNWTESKDFDKKFKVCENKLWNVVLMGKHKEMVTIAGETGKLSDILWKIYKGRFPANGEDDFIAQRDEIVKQIALFSPEVSQDVSQLLTQLRAQWQQRPKHNNDYDLRESIFSKTGFTLGDLKRMYGSARTIRKKLGLRRSQFVNTWPIEKQTNHFQSLYK